MVREHQIGNGAAIQAQIKPFDPGESAGIAVSRAVVLPP